MDKHTERWSVYLRHRQSSRTHPKEECGCRSPPEWSVPPERWFKPLRWGSSSRSLFSSGQLSSFMSHTWQDPEPSPVCVHIFWPRWVPEQGLGGRLAWLIMTWYPLPFWLRGIFLRVWSWGLPDSEVRKYVTSWSLPQQGLTSLCPCRYPCLNGPQKTDSSRLPCSCCYFYLKYKQVAGCKCLSWSPFISCLTRRPLALSSLTTHTCVNILFSLI